MVYLFEHLKNQTGQTGMTMLVVFCADIDRLLDFSRIVFLLFFLNHAGTSNFCDFRHYLKSMEIKGFDGVGGLYRPSLTNFILSVPGITT